MQSQGARLRPARGWEGSPWLVDFELTAEQKKLKYETREFAREVLRPAAELADALPDPQEALFGDAAGLPAGRRPWACHTMFPA